MTSDSEQKRGAVRILRDPGRVEERDGTRHIVFEDGTEVVHPEDRPFTPRAADPAPLGLGPLNRPRTTDRFIPWIRPDDPYIRRQYLMDILLHDDDVLPGLSPCAIEQQVFEQTGLKCWDEGARDRAAIENDRWSFDTAVCWIAAQTVDGALNGIASFRVWKWRLRNDACRPGQVMSFAEAERTLRLCLAAGVVSARVSHVNGAEQIPQSAWPNLEWDVSYPPFIAAVDLYRSSWTINGPEPSHTQATPDAISIIKPAQVETTKQLKSGVVEQDLSSVVTLAQSAESATGVTCNIRTEQYAPPLSPLQSFAEAAKESETAEAVTTNNINKASTSEIIRTIENTPTLPPLKQDDLIKHVQNTILKNGKTASYRAVYKLRKHYPVSRSPGDNAATLASHKSDISDKAKSDIK